MLNTERSYTNRSNVAFDRLSSKGVDVFNKYYANNGLAVEVYHDDLRNSVVICTLVSTDGDIVEVPSSYITSFPDSNSIPYSHVVISVDIGAVADTLNVEATLVTIADTVTAALGIDKPAVVLNSVPSIGLVSPQQHQVIESNRTSKITDVSTNVSKIHLLTEQVKDLSTENAALKEYIRLHT